MNTNNLTEFLKTAFEYKNNGDYKNSIDYFYKALAIDNESSEIMSELALLYTKLNQYDRALSFYEQILSRNPNNNEEKFNYALLLKLKKDYKKAEELLVELYHDDYKLEKTAEELFSICLEKNEYEKIITYYNQRSNALKSSEIVYCVALAYTKLEKEEIAKEFYKKSFDINSNNVSAGIRVANFLFDKGKIEEAYTLAIKLLKYAEDDKVIYLLGEIADYNNDIDEAIKYYSYAVNVNSQKALYHFKLAIAYSLKGFFKEAEENYASAVELEPKNEIYNYALAYLYYTNYKFDLAEKIVNYILNINPENKQVLPLKVLFLVNKNQSVQAGNYIKTIAKEKEKNDLSYYAIAMYYFSFNLWEKTITNLKKAIELNQTSLEYKYQLAKVYNKVAKYDEALNIFAQIVELSPKYIQAYINMGEIYIKKEEYDNAFTSLNKALDLEKNSDEIYDLLAKLYFLKQDYEKAIENYKLALSINPTKEEYFSNIGECYYNVKQYDSSYFYFKEATSFDISNAKYRYFIAKCSIQLNDKENALANFSLMKRLAPSNVEYNQEYANYLYSCGNKKMAIEVIKSTERTTKNIEDKKKLKEIIKIYKKKS